MVVYEKELFEKVGEGEERERAMMEVVLKV